MASISDGFDALLEETLARLELLLDNDTELLDALDIIFEVDDAYMKLKFWRLDMLESEVKSYYEFLDEHPSRQPWAPLKQCYNSAHHLHTLLSEQSAERILQSSRHNDITARLVAAATKIFNFFEDDEPSPEVLKVHDEAISEDTEVKTTSMEPVKVPDVSIAIRKERSESQEEVSREVADHDSAADPEKKPGRETGILHSQGRETSDLPTVTDAKASVGLYSNPYNILHMRSGGLTMDSVSYPQWSDISKERVERYTPVMQEPVLDSLAAGGLFQNPRSSYPYVHEATQRKYRYSDSEKCFVFENGSRVQAPAPPPVQG